MKMIEVEQEPDALPLRAILIVAGITFAIFVLAVIIAAEVARKSILYPVPPPRDTLERPLVAVTERGVTLQKERAKELDRWSWVDRDAGVASMPIEEAIDLTVKEQK